MTIDLIKILDFVFTIIMAVATPIGNTLDYLFPEEEEIQVVGNKAKDTPEVRKMLEVYRKQDHRIAFSGCEMTYNEKPFRLGMTIKELIEIFGEYDYFNQGSYVWKKASIVVSTSQLQENILNPHIYIYIYI